MREETDTNPNYPQEDLPDGRNTFCIEGVQSKMKGQTKFYIWTLSYPGGDGVQILLPSMMGELLRVLDCTETEKGKFSWDTDMVEGKHFDATVSHVPDRKDPNKIRQQMTDFKKAKVEDEVPF